MTEHVSYAPEEEAAGSSKKQSRLHRGQKIIQALHLSYTPLRMPEVVPEYPQYQYPLHPVQSKYSALETLYGSFPKSLFPKWGKFI